MKKSRIKNICIHRVPISESQRKDIDERLAEYYAKAVKLSLERMDISNEQKADVIKALTHSKR